MHYQLFHFALRGNLHEGMSRAEALAEARAYAFEPLPF